MLGLGLTIQQKQQEAKPLICLYNVGVEFGEHEDSRSNESDDQSDSEE